MKIDVVMPKMGESLQEGTIIRWLKQVGEKVERDEMILEISTDKVDTEVPAPNSGVLADILAQENETVEVGKVIAVIDTEAESGATSAPAENKSRAAANGSSRTTTVPKDTDVAVAEKEPVSSTEESSGSAVDVVMPKMGESLQEGTIIKWLKNVGDKVERDEMILEISTDKVDTEVPSPVAGILSSILVEEGETVEVGSVIAKISTGDAPAKPKSEPTASKEAQSKSDTSSSVQNETQETTSQQSSKDETLKVDGIEIPKNGTKEIPARKDGKFFSPLVRSIAQDNNVSLEELMQLKGSGIDSRVSKADLLQYIEKRDAEPKRVSKPVEKPVETPVSKPAPEKTVAATPVSAQKPQSVSFPDGDDIEVIPMDRIRQIIAEHMVYSKHTSAHVTSVTEVDVTNIVKMREKYKAQFEQREGFKLTYTPFFALAAVEAIKKFPMVNVSVDGKNILRHKRVNLGMATALPDGNLIVPVIKNADIMNATGIARSINDLATRARNKKLNPDEIQGGTFTLTNVGTFGTLFGTPVINQPQCGIMGVGAIKKRPVVKEVEGNDLILVRHIAYISLTYDHRVIDGMLAGQWLQATTKILENMNENTVSI